MEHRKLMEEREEEWTSRRGTNISVPVNLSWKQLPYHIDDHMMKLRSVTGLKFLSLNCVLLHHLFTQDKNTF